MDITDFATDDTNEWSELKAELVRATNAALLHPDKNTWLTAMINAAQLNITNATSIEIHEWPQDDTSDQSTPKLKRVFNRVVQRSITKSITDRIALIAILQVAETALA